MHHLTSEENSLADMLTRWAITKPEKILAHKSVQHLTNAVVNDTQMGGEIQLNKVANPNLRLILKEKEEARRFFERLDNSRISFIHPLHDDGWKPPSLPTLLLAQEKWLKENESSELSLMKDGEEFLEVNGKRLIPS